MQKKIKYINKMTQKKIKISVSSTHSGRNLSGQVVVTTLIEAILRFAVILPLTWLNLFVNATTLGASSNLIFFVQPQPDNSCI